MRAPASPAVPRRPDGVHPIAAMAPLPLDANRVAAVGAVRAAYDAVRDDPRMAALMTDARAEGHPAYVAALTASANLARRTAKAYAPARAVQSPF